MHVLVITDLEGPAGVDSFRQTRTGRIERKRSAMDRLASEVNACIEGVRSVAPDAAIDVWDGHGSGGLREGDLVGGRYLASGRPYFHLEDHDAVLFVGQHAMAGTPNAPLCHTYSSLSVDYYKLNGVFVGEFACRALIAGRQGVPTVFVAGDDKAILEARQFVPEIETAITKYGAGRESARHRDPDEVDAAIRDGAAAAVRRLGEIPPYTDLKPPYSLKIRYFEPENASKIDRAAGWVRQYVPPLRGLLPVATGVRRIDSRTIRVEAERLTDPESGLYHRL
ncbi:M55 family metallopeptidase [Halalkalicoccus jeotgali]|uniref:Peptidase M55 D-aminopeptidase n=1 Tax=Halalkalicoccus jeotgali (strain DSM 18796 / CECT 7217 / JCM 14584 / KCTC 4019 / B3) TaxID=795797 RepID=D8J2X3_HALJB|nr:M55 family metallopeptidase [Halalkalicoccus jeotgali]ADJ15080.1 peptidase M55 D-aminopeptidase [Halalkalicoccus jeotgali B3]ELY34901.1 peptidase M55 D-aminopeptidase [Halalkalicoccus jeotgali B3]